MNPTNQRKRKPSKSRRDLSPSAELALTYGKALLISVATAAVIILLGTAAALSTPDPDTLAAPIALAALFISSFVGGISSSRKSASPVISSVIFGAILLVFYALFSIFDYSSADIKLELLPSLFLHACVPLASILGGLLIMRRSSRAKRGPMRR